VGGKSYKESLKYLDFSNWISLEGRDSAGRNGAWTGRTWIRT